jgi:Secretion system C-terminal sorting domain
MRLIFTLIILIFLCTTGFAQKTASTGNWSNAATWSPAGVPTSTDNVIVPNGVTVTVDVAANCADLTIQTGGIVQGNSSLTVASGKIFTMQTGAMYKHNNTLAVSTNIFNGTETFDANSTFELQNWSGAAMPSSINFGNFTVNMVAGATSINMQAGLTTIQGTLLFLSTNSVEFRLQNRQGGTTTYNFNKIQVEANCNLVFCNNGGSSVSSHFLIVNSPAGFVQNGGTVNMGNMQNSGSTSTWNIGGDFLQTSGTVIRSQCVATINFYGTAPQSFTTVASGINTNPIAIQVDPGANVTLGANLTTNTLSGSITILGSTATTGTLNTGTYSVSTTAISINSGTMNTNGGTIDINGSAVLVRSASATGRNGILNVNGGAFIVRGSSGSFAVGGSVGVTATGEAYFTNGAILDIRNNNTLSVTITSGCTAQSCMGILSFDATSYATTTSGTGTFNMGTGFLRIGSPDGITTSGATGNIRTTNRNYSSGGVNCFEYNGAAAQVTGDGIPTTVTGQLKFNNSNGVSLSKSVTVNNSVLTPAVGINGTIAFIVGRVSLGNFDLQLANTSPTAMSGYSASSYVVTAGTGLLKRSIPTSTGNYDFPLGNSTDYKPASINFTTAPSVAGILSAKFSTAPPTFPNPTALVEGSITNISVASIQGSWFIDKDVSLTGGTYTGTFTSNGFSDIIDYTKIVLVKRPTAGGNWTLDGTHITTTGSNTAAVLSRTGMTGFSEFAIGGELGVSLPTTLTNSFTGTVHAFSNILYWATTTEINNNKFVIQRSANGSSFAAIGEVATKAVNGNSNIALNYNFVDANPVQGKQYYRLQMVDNGGRITYSPIVTLRRGAGKIEIVDVRPNPTTGTVYFNVLGTSNNINVAVRDLSGKEVIRKGLVQSNSFSMDLSKLATGMYILEAIDVKSNEKAVFKLVKD